MRHNRKTLAISLQEDFGKEMVLLSIAGQLGQHPFLEVAYLI